MLKLFYIASLVFLTSFTNPVHVQVDKGCQESQYRIKGDTLHICSDLFIEEITIVTMLGEIVETIEPDNVKAYSLNIDNIMKDTPEAMMFVMYSDCCEDSIFLYR